VPAEAIRNFAAIQYPYGVHELSNGQASHWGVDCMRMRVAFSRHGASLAANREIAEALGLSPKTIENYLSNIFQKIHVRRRAEAAGFFACQTRE
jgi:predicted transcriptional regulator